MECKNRKMPRLHIKTYDDLPMCGADNNNSFLPLDWPSRDTQLGMCVRCERMINKTINAVDCSWRQQRIFLLPEETSRLLVLK